MSEPKPEPGKPNPGPAPKAGGEGFVAKLKGLFSKSSPNPKAPAPAPKKGQSSFLKNFKVKDVGTKEPEASPSVDKGAPAPKSAATVEPAWSKHLQETANAPKAPVPPKAPASPAPPTSPASTNKPLPTPYTGKITPAPEAAKRPQSIIVGPDEDAEEVPSKPAPQAPKAPPSSGFNQKETGAPAVAKASSPQVPKSAAQMMLPKTLPDPKEVSPKPATASKPVQPGQAQAPKPPDLLPFPPKLSEPKEMPSKPATPAPIAKTEPGPAAGSLLPGQKKGDEIGKLTGGTQILRKPAPENSPTQPDSLPSLPPKPTASPVQAPPKPAIVKSPEPKPAIVKDLDPKPTPAPDTRRTSTGTLKKESLRLKPLPSGDFKPMVTGKPEPESKPHAPAAAKPAIKPEPKDAVKPPGQPQVPVQKPSAEKPAPGAVPGKVAPAGLIAKPAGNDPAKPSAKAEGVPKPTPAVKPADKPKAAATPASARPSQKKKPKVVLPPRREEEKKNSPLLFLIPLIILLLAGIAFALYWNQRETSVIVNVDAGEMTLRGDGIVIMNFAGKLQMLRDDYFRRRAPLEEEVERIQANLAAAQVDLAGREQRKKLLDDMLEQYEAEIPEFLTESQQALNSLWEDKSAQLAREYDEFKESLHQEIIARAEELGVDYQRNTEIDAIAVAVNAFRLALYGVAREVDVSEQRAWAEDILQRWKAYEKQWRDAQADIKEEALEIKKQPLPKIADARKRIDNLEREIAAVEIDLQSLRDEVARHEQTLREASQRLEDIADPFFLDLKSIPKDFEVARFPVENNGVIRMPRLNESEELTEGTHFLLVRALKEDMEYWAVSEFEILPYQTVESTVRSDQFVPLQTILEEGIFMKP